MEKLKQNPKLMIIIAIVVVVVVIVTIVGVVVFANGNKGIELTEENYADYLQISAYRRKADDAKEYLYRDKGSAYNIKTTEAYNKINFSGYVKGKSSNFNYEEVEVQIHIYEDCTLYNNDNWQEYGTLALRPTTEKQHIDQTITIKCDISGNQKEILGNGDVDVIQSINGESKENYIYLKELQDKENVKVDITVKGKVTPVGK